MNGLNLSLAEAFFPFLCIYFFLVFFLPEGVVDQLMRLLEVFFAALRFFSALDILAATALGRHAG